MTNYQRREFLKNSATTAIVGLGNLSALAQFSTAAPPEKKSPSGNSIDEETERVYRLIRDTPQEDLMPVIFRELRKGMTQRRLLSALFLESVRHNGHHRVFAHHSINQLSLEVGREERLLPLLYHADGSKWRVGDHAKPPLTDDQLPSLRESPDLLERAVRKGDPQLARPAVIAMARSEGPKKTYGRFWRYTAANAGPHYPISIANVYRSLETIGWEHAEPFFQLMYMNQNRVRFGGDTEQLTKDTISQLPNDWAGSRANKEAVLELVSAMLAGNAIRACKAACEKLVAGDLQAHGVWDAVFLTASETMMGHFVQVHTTTGVNGMHFAFRSAQDPQAKLHLLVQAVKLATDMGRERTSKGLGLTPIPEVDSPVSIEDAVEQIFTLLPPRRAFHWFSGAGIDRLNEARRLTYSLALQHKDFRLFFQTARRLLCVKSTVDTHDLKFPIAIFENYQYISPQWRPRLLAASVAGLHGTQMEDSPFIAQAREELRSFKF